MKPTPPAIVLLTESSKCESLWQSLLSEAMCSTISKSDLSSDKVIPDIVITDSQQQLNSSRERLPCYFGVIAIGSAIRADVVFDIEPTSRELQIAVKLLHEIVQHRRERDHHLEAEQRLTEIAETDSLTGLANRRAWDAELIRWVNERSKGAPTICLALLDLDHFKEINTNHGYSAADEVLRQTGRALQASVRSEDFVARIGGDEFGLLLASISMENSEIVVDRIRSSIKEALTKSGAVVVAATAGCAVWEHGMTEKELFDAADYNLRTAKQAGRNQTAASR